MTPDGSWSTCGLKMALWYDEGLERPHGAILSTRTSLFSMISIHLMALQHCMHRESLPSVQDAQLSAALILAYACGVPSCERAKGMDDARLPMSRGPAPGKRTTDSVLSNHAPYHPSLSVSIAFVLLSHHLIPSSYKYSLPLLANPAVSGRPCAPPSPPSSL